MLKKMMSLFFICFFAFLWNQKIEANEEPKIKVTKDGNDVKIELCENYLKPFNEYGEFEFGSERISEVNVSDRNEIYASKNGVLYSKDMKTLIFYPPQKKEVLFEVPETVEIIEKQINSPYLKELFINKNIVQIPSLSICTGGNFESVKVSDENEKYTSKDGVLYSKDMKTLIFYPPQKKAALFEVPETVEIIKETIKSPYLKKLFFDKNIVQIPTGGVCKGENFESVTVSGENDKYASKDGVLYSKDMKIIYEYPRGKKGEKFEIPQSVEKIYDNCFYGSSLREITGQSVRTVEQCAFLWCYYLERVELGNQVEEIKNNAFWCCRSLNKIVFPQSLKKIESSNDNSIKEVVFRGEILTCSCAYVQFINVENSNINHKDGCKCVLDVPSSWAEKELEQAKEFGLITENLSYGVKSRITRSEVCELLVNMLEMVLGTEVEGQENIFLDTSEKNVEKCFSIGVVNGVGEDRFSPGTYVSREQMATMLYRSIKYIYESKGYIMEEETEIDEEYADRDSVSKWAVNAVATLNKTGIMQGTSETMLSPYKDLTVEEAIIFVKRAYNYMKVR